MTVSMKPSTEKRVLRRERLNNLSDLLRDAASNASQGIDVHFSGSLERVQHLTYRELFQIATRNGDVIRTFHGVRPDSIFLLHFDSHLDGIIWFWSVTLAGYMPAMSPPFVHNVEQHRKHLHHLKQLLQDPIVLTTSKFAPYIRDHCEGLQVEIAPTLEIPLGGHDHAALNGAVGRVFNRATDGEINGHSLGHTHRETDRAFIMLTSGSTGAAKAVCLSNQQVLEAIRGKIACHRTTRADVFLNWINLDHVANLTESHLHAMYLGAKQVHVHASDLVSSPLKYLSLIDRHRVSFSFAPNFFLASLTRALRNEPDAVTIDGMELDLSCLRCITSGGEALVVKTCVALIFELEQFGAPRNCFVPGFGMTETGAGSIHHNSFPDYDLQHDLKFASLGTCHPGIHMRVVASSKKGGSPAPAPAGEVGQLQVRGPIVFSEYYNDPENTRKAFTDDGWFITGDLAVIDDWGMLQFLGREKDSVNINGVKHSMADLQTAVDMEALPGVTPSYIVVFGHRPEDQDTEAISVVYLPSYEPEDGRARLEATRAISKAVLLQCNAQPYKIIPLTTRELQKTSLGKLSASKIKWMFEDGRFSEQDKLNQQLLSEYHASLAANGHGDVDLSDTELAIQSAVAEVMGLEPAQLGLDSGMMQMGVNSMQLIQFKKAVQDRLAIADIPMITILTNPTIRELAVAVDEQLAKKQALGYDPVVVLNQTGSGTPLWLVHPGAGEILVYLNLAKYFVDERPVYALRARGFDGEPFFDDLSECIGTYFDAIKRVQPEGPYNVLGYSFGSMFAFELAKRLQAAGGNITFLGVLNLPPHIKQRIRQLNMVTAVLTLALFLDLVEDDDPETFHPNIASMSYDDVLDEILNNRAPPGRMESLALDRAKLLRWAEVSNALHEMAWDYEPSGMVDHVDIFVAHPLKAVASNRRDWFEKQISRWVHFSESLPRFHEAAGEHFSMISAEHVESFQARLKAAMLARGA